MNWLEPRRPKYEFACSGCGKPAVVHFIYEIREFLGPRAPLGPTRFRELRHECRLCNLSHTTRTKNDPFPVAIRHVYYNLSEEEALVAEVMES